MHLDNQEIIPGPALWNACQRGVVPDQGHRIETCPMCLRKNGVWRATPATSDRELRRLSDRQDLGRELAEHIVDIAERKAVTVDVGGDAPEHPGAKFIT
jgi:hypothetical protein